MSTATPRKTIGVVQRAASARAPAATASPIAAVLSVAGVLPRNGPTTRSR